MAKPGDRHEVMTDFFGNHIQSLFPDCVISYGKVLKPVGLKPDIFVTMPDGRKWVFEMVHENRNPAKIQSNHIRYQQAGIQDTWILWDDLCPKSKRRVSPSQGIFTEAFNDPPIYRLTKPQETLLNLWPNNPKYLYTFSIDPFQIASQMDLSKMLSAMMIGICVYQFDGSKVGDRYAISTNYISLASLKFLEDGKIVIPEDDPILDKTIQALHFDPGNNLLPDLLINLQNLISTPDGLKLLTETYLKNWLLSLPQKEKDELMAFIQSGQAQNIQPFSGRISASEGFTSYDDLQKLTLLSEDMKELESYVENLALPNGIKQILIDSNKSQEFLALVEIYHQQAVNPHYRALD